MILSSILTAYLYECLKVKTEAKEVKRRGKYNKDKAGNLGKLGRKAMKEVKVDQVGIFRIQTSVVKFSMLLLRIELLKVNDANHDVMSRLSK